MEKSKRKYVLLFIMIFILIFKYYSEVNASDQNTKKIKVIVANEYPPYAFKDENGQLKGSVIDIWKMWQKKTGIKVELYGSDLENVSSLMNTGQYDVVDVLFMNKENENKYEFSKMYDKVDVAIFFHKNIAGINDVKSLKGFEVAVKKGDYIESFLKKSGIEDLKEYESYEELIKDAKDEKITVFVMDKAPALYYIYKMGIEDKFDYTNPLYSSGLYRAVPKEKESKLNIIENGFSQITKDEQKEIEKKWIGKQVVYNKYLKYVGILYIIIMGILIAVISWNYILKRNVKIKTKELIKVLEDLKISEQKYKKLLRNLNVGVAVHDEKGKIVIANDEYFKLIGLTESEVEFNVLKKDSYNFIDEKGKKMNFNELPGYMVLKTGKGVYNFTMGIKRVKNNDIVWVKCDAFPQHNNENSLKEIVVTLVDITKIKESEARIYEMSVCDSLTKLHNRNYFENELKKLKSKENKSIGICICDLDGLKLINDSLGHHVGDEYLKLVADILKNSFRKNDIISRIGGDEFAIISTNISLEEIKKIRMKIFDNIKFLNNNQRLIPISMSIGYFISDDKVKDLDNIFKQADNNMYKEKLLHRQSNKSQIVQVLSKMLEARDFITEGHSERLEKLAVKLASSIGMSENEIEDISLLAHFHDIGKVGIPDRILFKNGKLNDEETEEMKRHTEIGYRIASAAPNLSHIADLIYKHHEFWNGEGYPLGIKEEEIPIQCRIISIVDAYDAMTNDRPYRKALTKYEAINELKRCSGKQFDPNLVEKFMKII